MFGVLLAIVGITVTAQTTLVSAHLSNDRLESVLSDDTSVVRVLVNGTLAPGDLQVGSLTGSRRADLQAQLAAVVTRGGMLRVEVRATDGQVLFSSDGLSLPVMSAADFANAAAGSSAASVVAAPVPAYGTPQVLSEQLPIIAGGRVLAVFVVARDAVPILQGIESVRQEIIMLTLAGALIVAFVLYLIFRSAHRRLRRQTEALLEATRHDPLTGSLNHGALVTELAGQLEAARLSGTSVGTALVDIDGFRLLNDTHGHGAGDEALLETYRHLATVVPTGSVFGRYGPDEFLVIAPAIGASVLESAIEALRTGLLDVSLQYGDTERLPLTISAGICGYPRDASSVTELLSVGASTVAEAKASGGDEIRVADPDVDQPGIVKTFDVLRGLVIAVDTKDRYTKRHSEDVARYADLIALRVGVEPELRRAIHIAALLHDVGKVGIPDSLLRKPAKLTAEEFAAFGQHVALGDMIVRDLPDIDLVRAGIRHHHERWDGRGYLEGLAGQDIPLIARIVAVADAFSAMTTTRPYRKALEVDEAKHRLHDAAGTQLDPDLVPAFLEALGGTKAPVQPEVLGWRSRIWSPVDQVA